MIRLVLISILAFGITNNGFAQLVQNFYGELFTDDALSVEQTGNSPTELNFIENEVNSTNKNIFDLPRTNGGIAFLSSAIVPGLGQAANGKWARAGLYFATEVVGVIYHLDRNATAKRQESAYERYTHQNWSVVAYAQWLVNYSQANDLNNNWQQLNSHLSGKNPDFSNTTNDWGKVDLGLLHSIERQTPFVFDGHYGSNFSHALPQYGSQQYYELISKYYQYHSGWKDWYNAYFNPQSNNYISDPSYRYMWNGDDEPNELFYKGRDRAEEFNDNYRVAGNILKLLIVNHVVSAFDAFLTVQLKNSRIEADANLMRLEQFSLTWHF